MPKYHCDADEAAQRGVVVQRLLTSQISQISQIAPVLQKVDAQHAFLTDGRSCGVSLGVIRLDHGTSLLPGSDAIVSRNTSHRLGLR
jgi:hypothetical protein